VEQLQALKEVVREELRDLQRRAREPRFDATATSQAAAASAASLASQGLGRQPRKGRKRAASTQYKRVYGDGASVVATWPLHFMSQGAEHL